MFKPRNLLLLLVSLPLLLFFAYAIAFAYRTNSCAPGDDVLQSEADAIKQAKIRISRARYGSHGVPGYLDEKPELVDFDKSDHCCSAKRSRTIFGVVVWEVLLLHGETIGEPKKRDVGVQMSLSNCGAIFVDESFITADPIR